MKIEIPESPLIAEIQISYKPLIKPSLLPTVKCSEDVYKLFLSTWDESQINYVEHFKVMLLNRANKVIGICTLTTGNNTTSIADPRMVFALALKTNASGVILAHNHPSGNRMPSQADLEISKRMKEAGKLLEISVLDHIIITTEEYYSFADEGAF
jgi:DNA repair protein RadC